MTDRVLVQVGDRPPSMTVGPLSRTDIVRYAGASGDLTPAHHDDDAARRAGQPQVFAMGMLSAGILGSFAASWLGAANTRTFSTRFHEVVRPGDVLECSAAITSIEVMDDQAGALAHVDLVCERVADRAVVTRGHASFVVLTVP